MNISHLRKINPNGLFSGEGAVASGGHEKQTAPYGNGVWIKTKENYCRWQVMQNHPHDLAHLPDAKPITLRTDKDVIIIVGRDNGESFQCPATRGGEDL